MPTATSSLDTIRQKVRRLTRSPSLSQLTNNDIDQYVNTFIAYDIPENLRLFDLRKTFTFYTTPFVDTYSTSPTSTSDPLYDFDQKYITVHRPLYIAGYNSMYTQSREQFYGMYPVVSTMQQIAVGTGSYTGPWTFQAPNTPILQGSVIVESIAATTALGLQLVDNPDPADPTSADLVIPGTTAPSYGTINYLTGQMTINNLPDQSGSIINAPASQAPINVQYVPYTANRPQVMLHFDGQFILRPIPDQVYPVQFEVYVRPTQLLASGESPQLQQWWQYIAYGAAKKIFEDRLDMESLQAIMPEYNHQECLVLRKTLVQNATQRSSTIYTENLSMDYWGFGNWWYNGQAG